MNEELEQKAGEFCIRIKHDDGEIWYGLEDIEPMLVEFANEVTKELQEKLEIQKHNTHTVGYLGDCIEDIQDKKLTKAKKLLSTLVSICKSCIPLETLKLNEQFIIDAETFLKE